MTDPTSISFPSALLVEDENNLAIALKIALRKIGIPVSHASTLKKAHSIVSTSPPQLVLLDRRLPDGDGLELCKDLRKNGFTGAIIILTAVGQTEDRVHGLNAGADDYLSKPFAWEELHARIRALSRRMSCASAPKDQLWICDDSRRRIYGPGGWVELTALEFKLANFLISAKGAIISREDLLKQVWGFSFLPKTRTVDFFMSRLRKRFEKDPEAPRYFLTVRGAGYRFQAQ